MQSNDSAKVPSSRAREAAARPGWTRAGGQRIRVLIVADHAILRQALRYLLEAHNEI